jgi:hypothetical protein
VLILAVYMSQLQQLEVHERARLAAKAEAEELGDCLCVLVLLYILLPHTAIHLAASYYHICVFVQLHMCLRNTACVLKMETEVLVACRRL